MATKNEVLRYTEASVDIYFPAGEEKCALCPLLQTYSRNQCMRTGELIADTRGRGMWCPLNFKETKEVQIIGEIPTADPG